MTNGKQAAFFFLFFILTFLSSNINCSTIQGSCYRKQTTSIIQEAPNKPDGVHMIWTLSSILRCGGHLNEFAVYMTHKRKEINHFLCLAVVWVGRVSRAQQRCEDVR